MEYARWRKSMVPLLRFRLVIILSGLYGTHNSLLVKICYRYSWMMRWIFSMGLLYVGISLEGCRCVGAMCITIWIAESLQCGTWRPFWANQFMSGILACERVILGVLIC
ncbi:PREDICTED: uncharacterized protein LOC109176338 [Ipomoea nil]|uniref:uncharacterized protein LOC109176338 n=1 Tax=Ipomoea nil TaxID=35883 RepID=UPI0009008843|nr:PREDICTED: uncharacterized protein LOC109176338 [Ipomoea nil]